MKASDLDKIHLSMSIELHKIRSCVIEVERLMRVMHQDRHPIPKPEIDLPPTQPLDPITRAEIDATP